MRPLASAARLRRQPRLLVLAPILLAGVVAACFAGEAIPPSSAGPITGRYVLSYWTEDASTESLPAIVGVDTGGQPIRLQYATLDVYEDGTYAEVYDLEVWNKSQTEMIEQKYDIGNGTWSDLGGDIKFTATLPPALFSEVTSWTGRRGDGGHYAFNIRRAGEDDWFLHYRRY